MKNFIKRTKSVCTGKYQYKPQYPSYDPVEIGVSRNDRCKNILKGTLPIIRRLKKRRYSIYFCSKPQEQGTKPHSYNPLYWINVNYIFFTNHFFHSYLSDFCKVVEYIVLMASCLDSADTNSLIHKFLLVRWLRLLVLIPLLLHM